MIRPGQFVLISLAFLGALTAVGYATFTRYFNWSQVIALFSLFGYAVLLFYLWCAAGGVLARKPVPFYGWPLILLTVFFTICIFALDFRLIPPVLLGAAGGLFTVLQKKKAALLCGLFCTGFFAYRMTSDFWQQESRSVIIFALIFLGCALYFGFPNKKKTP